MKIQFASSESAQARTVVFLIGPDGVLSARAEALDARSGRFVRRILETHGTFSGKHGQTLVRTLPDGAGPVHIVFAGTGPADKLNGCAVEILGGKILAALEGAGLREAYLHVEGACGPFTAAETAVHLAAGARLQDYRFDRYKTKAPVKGASSKAAAKPVVSKGAGFGVQSDSDVRVEALTFVLPQAEQAQGLWTAAQSSVDGTLYVRDLVNEPPNCLYPDVFARKVQADLEPLGVRVTVYDEKKLKSMGHTAHLAVGIGSDHPPRLVVLEWNGLGKAAGRKAGKDSKHSKDSGPVAFVGKGLTFDAGGLNLKPTGGIEDMKLDMAGAATVAALFMVLARRKARVHAVGVLGLAENMISGHSYRPSDIIQTLSGKTVEIGNTDAEGRVVLGDCLTYVQRQFAPHTVIDLATLTGAMMIALGHEYCGTFANDDGLWAALEGAGKESGEKIWRMPLDEAWKKEDEGTISDLVNIGAGRPNAGACTAAAFLEHFIEDGTMWAHMDIAGVAWVKAARPNQSKGGTGYGVRLLDRLVARHFEK